MMELRQRSVELEFSAHVMQGLRDRYLQLRSIGLRLNHMLVERLSHEEMSEGGRRLGLYSDNCFTFQNESETIVLMDYCLFNLVHNGKNKIEQYLDGAPPVEDEIEKACFDAMRSATYALLVVERVVQGVGCYVRNLTTDTRRLLIDLGLSSTAIEGMVLVTRLLDYGDFVATGGASLPIANMASSENRDLLAIVKAEFLKQDFDPATIIQIILGLGASSRIRYDDASSQSAQTPRLESHRRRALVTVQDKRLVQMRASLSPSNRRCRCGSGKMYKNCCGK